MKRLLCVLLGSTLIAIATSLSQIVLDTILTIPGYGSGNPISADGNYVLVGEPYVDQTGAAFIFYRGPQGWVQQAKLAGDVGETQFGARVAISGDHVLITASSGVYVYIHDSTGWSQQQKSEPFFSAFSNEFSVQINNVAQTIDFYKLSPTGELNQQTSYSASPLSEINPSTIGATLSLSKNHLIVGDKWFRRSANFIDIGCARCNYENCGCDTCCGFWPQRTQPGSVYFFDRLGDSWSLTNRLVLTNYDTLGLQPWVGEESGNNSSFATTFGNDAFIGHWTNAEQNPYYGTVEIDHYTYNSGSWTKDQKIFDVPNAYYYSQILRSVCNYLFIDTTLLKKDGTSWNTVAEWQYGAPQALSTRFAFVNHGSSVAIYRIGDSTNSYTNTRFYFNTTRLINGKYQSPTPIDTIIYGVCGCDSIKPAKICADGSKSTVIYFSTRGADISVSNLTFRIAEDPDHADTATYGEFDTPVPLTRDSLVVRYQHPNRLHPDSLTRKFKIQVINKGDGSIVSEAPIEIYRAPVLLVHGLWSDKGAFQQMEKDLQGSLWPSTAPSKALTYRVDYSDSAGYHFSLIVHNVPDGIKQVLAAARKNGFSAAKVDVIAHSMGGILSRLYLQDYRYRGDIDRFISINTPHSGTQAANLLTDNNFPLIAKVVSMKDITHGAVDDLRIDSDAILNYLNGHPQDAPQIPAVALRTHSTYMSNIPFVGDGDNSEKAILLVAASVIYHTIPTVASVQTLLNNLYNGNPNDFIVPDSSQIGGLALSNLVDHQSHSGSPSNPSVIGTVIGLLQASPDNLYTTNGFNPPQLTYTIRRSILSKPADFAYLENSDYVSFTDPPRGSSYTAGQTVRATVLGSSNITSILLWAGDIGSDAYVDQQVGNSTQFNFQIPKTTLGTFQLLAVGFADSGSAVIDTLNLNVNAPSSLQSIQSDPKYLFLSIGQSAPLYITGIFADSVTRSLNKTGNLGLNSADDGVARRVGIRSIEGVSEGTTSVTVEYQGKIDTVLVEVSQELVTGVRDSGDIHPVGNNTVPTEYKLTQNYPNPFNPITTIQFSLPKPSYTVLKVFNLLGQEVAILVSQHLNTGTYSFDWDASSKSSGVYFYRLHVGSFVQTKKLLLLR